nr:transposase [Kineobactrum salinum]
MYGDRDEVVFTWSASRSRHHAQQQLCGFTGVLLTDGYEAYSLVGSDLNWNKARIAHANCWAHSRRAFERALAMEPVLAQYALDLIARLYQIEAAIRARELVPDEVAAWRIQHSVPILEALFAWVRHQRQRPGIAAIQPAHQSAGLCP